MSDFIRQLQDMKERIDTLFARSFGTGEQHDSDEASKDCRWQPAADVWETENHWHLAVDVPGVEESSLALEIGQGKLIVAGFRDSSEAGEGDRAQRLERPRGRFRRVFDLPDNISSDQIEAVLKNGVLEVAISKAARPPRGPVKIDVRNG